MKRQRKKQAYLLTLRKMTYSCFFEILIRIVYQSQAAILHPPLYPLPSREGRITPPYSSPYLRGGMVGLYISPIVGEGKGEGYFRDKCYILPVLFQDIKNTLHY